MSVHSNMLICPHIYTPHTSIYSPMSVCLLHPYTCHTSLCLPSICTLSSPYTTHMFVHSLCIYILYQHHCWSHAVSCNILVTSLNGNIFKMLYTIQRYPNMYNLFQQNLEKSSKILEGTQTISSPFANRSI